MVQLHLGPQEQVHYNRALSSSGRATDLHSVGEEFDSPRVHKCGKGARPSVFFVFSLLLASVVANWVTDFYREVNRREFKDLQYSCHSEPKVRNPLTS